MLFLDPSLAVISLFPVPFVILIAARYGRRSRPAIQEVQQRLAELTADVEESIGGVRVIKAFAAEGRQNRRIRTSAERVFTQSMVSTRLQAFYNPFIGFLPQLGLAAILFHARPADRRGTTRALADPSSRVPRKTLRPCPDTM